MFHYNTMGRALQNQDPCISPKTPPGCNMWGIFHNLNQNRQGKRLPTKRKGGGKRVAVVEDLGDNATAAEDSSIISKTIETNQVSKGSMLLRIRSLITQEVTSKRKGRHQRSSSCPVELEKTSYKEKYSVVCLLDPPPEKACDCAIQKPMQLENMRKDSSKLMFSFMKSVSFHSRRSRGRKASMSRKHKNKMECGHYAKGEDDRSQVGNEVSGSAGFNSHSVTPTDLSSDDEVGKHMLIKRAECAEKKERESSKLILDRFKNLKQKLRYALKESRKERHRIVMDAVLHKVPHGHSSLKDIEKGSTFAHCNSSFTKSEMKSIRRTSSVNESLDRYNPLHDSCFYREEKHHISDRSSFRASRSPSPARTSPIGLARILSMPDLSYYNSFKLEHSPEHGSSYTLERNTSTNNLYIGISKSNEQKSLDIPLGSENQGHYLDSRSTIFLDVSESFDDFGSLKTRENSSSIENTIKSTSSVVSDIDKPIPVPLSDMIFQNSTSGAAGLSAAKGAEEDAVDTDENGGSSNELNRILQIQVDKRYKLEFDYVKDVIELSGFSGNKLLGEWHSAEKPVNPSLFDEVEGYCLLDQEGVTCDQLLLFELINEVLLQIYERSCSYWPKSLTCRSYMHTMPVGYHVLGEVWKEINSCLESEMKIDQRIDDAVSRDLAKDESWMNLQFDAVCLGLELEELILNDLLEELVFT